MKEVWRHGMCTNSVRPLCYVNPYITEVVVLDLPITSLLLILA